MTPTTEERIISRGTYVRVAGILLGLLALTIWVATIHLGVLNTVAAMTIAVVKMLLVVLYFMHLRYSNRLIWLIAGAGFFWLAVLIGLTLSDFLTRGGPVSPGL